ncbi:MAG: tRNA (cytidine(56)-2'-O)-methyltransferase [Natronomonas sp.]
MQDEHDVVVVRLGHRPGRDDRMTTHVGLTARALGADRFLTGTNASGAAQTVREVTERFGGPFTVETSDSLRSYLQSFDGTVVHLTMYGLPVQREEATLRTAHEQEAMAVVVGAEKVSFDIYEIADHNVAVTNQPHSEVAGLAVFLDRLFDGRELERTWTDADRRVVPKATGKLVEPVDDADSEAN